jgi:hypothetical protein
MKSWYLFALSPLKLYETSFKVGERVDVDYHSRIKLFDPFSRIFVDFVVCSSIKRLLQKISNLFKCSKWQIVLNVGVCCIYLVSQVNYGVVYLICHMFYTAYEIL